MSLINKNSTPRRLELGARSLVDLYGLVAFLRLDPLAERRLFVRTLERPIKSGDPLGLMRLQVAPPGCYLQPAWPAHCLPCVYAIMIGRLDVLTCCIAWP